MLTRPAPKIPLSSEVLRVIIRDDAPMVECNDSPSYRSVAIKLTKEQREKLALNATYCTGGIWYHERYSNIFIEQSK